MTWHTWMPDLHFSQSSPKHIFVLISLLSFHFFYIFPCHFQCPSFWQFHHRFTINQFSTSKTTVNRVGSSKDSSNIDDLTRKRFLEYRWFNPYRWFNLHIQNVMICLRKAMITEIRYICNHCENMTVPGSTTLLRSLHPFSFTSNLRK